MKYFKDYSRYMNNRINETSLIEKPTKITYGYYIESVEIDTVDYEDNQTKLKLSFLIDPLEDVICFVEVNNIIINVINHSDCMKFDRFFDYLIGLVLIDDFPYEDEEEFNRVKSVIQNSWNVYYEKFERLMYENKEFHDEIHLLFEGKVH